MQNEDQQLLRRFVSDRDDAAFETVVRRHLGLVLGAAQRQLGGDHHAAQDVAQQVFSLLASKAASLVRHDHLEAWLHTTTRHTCQSHIRTAMRRARREQEAVMNLADQPALSLWEQLAPELDEALHELGEDECSLILQRHLEQQSGEALAARLGVSEPAVRKRLERALTRLRELLAKRGITLSVAALTSAIEMNAQAQMPAGLATQIARQAIAQAGATAGIAGWSAWLRPAAILGGIALLVGLALVFTSPTPSAPATAVRPAPPTETVLHEAANPTLPTTNAVAVAEVRQFTLNVVDAETRQPLTGAAVNYYIGYDDHTWIPIADKTWATNGPMWVTWTNDCFHFTARVVCEGYADTWVDWSREKGVLPVPEQWTLLMERAPTLGGVAVDEQGNPVPSASVSVMVCNNGELLLPVPGTQQPALSHPNQRIGREVTTQTDANGRWSIRRIASAVQNLGVTIFVQHPDYQKDRSDLKTGNQLPALQAETYRSVLKRQNRIIISGVVRDSFGNPLAHARVTDGTLFSTPNTTISGDQHLTTDDNGRFSFTKDDQRHLQITVKADGFAARTVPWAGKPLDITLSPGRSLRLLVTNPKGEPIPGIRVESTTFQNSGGSETNQSTRYALTTITDESGRVAWTEVPDEPLLMMFWSDLPDYLTQGGQILQPSEAEQTIVITPALKVSGTVTDAETGLPLATFRVANLDVFGKDTIPAAEPFGLPDTVSGKLFENGQFELQLKPNGGPIAPSLSGPPEHQQRGSYLKITAPGYAAHTTRFLDVKEGVVDLAIALKRAVNTRIQVLDPARYGAAGVEVVACSASGGLELDGRSGWTLSGDYRLRTDGNGCFILPADESLRMVCVLDSARSLLGWASVETLRREGQLQLSQLHRLELFPTLAGNPLTGKDCEVKLTSPALQQLTGDEERLWAVPDATGKCLFVGLPAGTYQATAKKAGQTVGQPCAIEIPADAPALGQKAWAVDEALSAPTNR